MLDVSLVTGPATSVLPCEAYPLDVLVEPRWPVDGSRRQEGEEEAPHVSIEHAVPLEWL